VLVNKTKILAPKTKMDVSEAREILWTDFAELTDTQIESIIILLDAFAILIIDKPNLLDSKPP
jgi:hypothetical protein